MCEDCIYAKVELAHELFGMSANQCFCRRYPPINVKERSDVFVIYLVVYKDGWCGEFARRLE